MSFPQNDTAKKQRSWRNLFSSDERSVTHSAAFLCGNLHSIDIGEDRAEVSCFSPRHLGIIYKRFVALADQIKVVEDRHLMAIIQEETPGLAGIEEMAKGQAVGRSVGTA